MTPDPEDCGSGQRASGGTSQISFPEHVCNWVETWNLWGFHLPKCAPKAREQQKGIHKHATQNGHNVAWSKTLDHLNLRGFPAKRKDELVDLIVASVCQFLPGKGSQTFPMSTAGLPSHLQHAAFNVESWWILRLYRPCRPSQNINVADQRHMDSGPLKAWETGAAEHAEQAELLVLFGVSCSSCSLCSPMRCSQPSAGPWCSDHPRVRKCHWRARNGEREHRELCKICSSLRGAVIKHKTWWDEQIIKRYKNMICFFGIIELNRMS